VKQPIDDISGANKSTSSDESVVFSMEVPNDANVSEKILG